MKNNVTILFSIISVWTCLNGQMEIPGLLEFDKEVERIILNADRDPRAKITILTQPFQEKPTKKSSWSEKHTIQFINDSIFKHRCNLYGQPYYGLIRNNSIFDYDFKYQTTINHINIFSNPDSLGYVTFTGISGFTRKAYRIRQKYDSNLRLVESIYQQDSSVQISTWEYPDSNIVFMKQYNMANSDSILDNSVYNYNTMFQNQIMTVDTTIIRRYHDETNPMNIILTVKKYTFENNGQIVSIEKCLYYDNSTFWAERSTLKVIRKKKK